MLFYYSSIRNCARLVLVMIGLQNRPADPSHGRESEKSNPTAAGPPRRSPHLHLPPTEDRPAPSAADDHALPAGDHRDQLARRTTRIKHAVEIRKYLQDPFNQRFRRIMKEGERCVCAECDYPPACLVMASELNHNSKLARDLKSKEVTCVQRQLRRGEKISASMAEAPSKK